MNKKQVAYMEAVKALQQYGVNSVLFRNAIGKKLGLNITDIGCINYLFAKGPSNPTELARYTGLTTGSTTTMLDRLERKNLILRKPNPSDRRGVVIEVSKVARDTVGVMTAGAQAKNMEIMDDYKPEELEVIANFLRKFADAMHDRVDAVERS